MATLQAGGAGDRTTSPPGAPVTAWARNLGAPVRSFLHQEIGGAAVLLAATVVALIWANAAPGSYEHAWHTELSLRIGGHGIAQPLREWVNNGLMALFFFVVGLEARREFDMGELRDRRRVALPVLAGIGGMVVPVLLYLAITRGGPGAHGWGAAMSTDTAFALGVLALVGPRRAERLRVFLLTVVVADDVVALVVIATVYSSGIDWTALGSAAALLALALGMRRSGVRGGLPYAVVGIALWGALYRSGVDPLIAGLAMGLLTFAHSPVRSDLEGATKLVRLFREQPTAELMRSARAGLDSAISPNERLQHLIHPWTSMAIVPLFALANVGIPLRAGILERAVTSPVTLGIVAAYVLGKPVGIVGVAWLASRRRLGGMRLPVGLAPLAGGGAVAGVGFTVALLISTLAFKGEQLAEAKIGILAAAILATVTGAAVFRLLALLPAGERARRFAGTAAALVDLAADVDMARDHVRGPADAPVTIVEYGDFECPFCSRAEPVLRELLAEFGDDLRYVFRHLPLTDVHPRAQVAAEAAEAAAAQGAFWELHDLLFAHQDALRPSDLIGYAEQLGLDVGRFEDELRRHAHAPRIAEDVDDADRSGVSGTPTVFVNGLRHHGAFDLASLEAAVHTARLRARPPVTTARPAQS